MATWASIVSGGTVRVEGKDSASAAVARRSSSGPHGTLPPPDARGAARVAADASRQQATDTKCRGNGLPSPQHVGGSEGSTSPLNPQAADAAQRSVAARAGSDAARAGSDAACAGERASPGVGASDAPSVAERRDGSVAVVAGAASVSSASLPAGSGGSTRTSVSGSLSVGSFDGSHSDAVGDSAGGGNAATGEHGGGSVGSGKRRHRRTRGRRGGGKKGRRAAARMAGGLGLWPGQFASAYPAPAGAPPSGVPWVATTPVSFAPPSPDAVAAAHGGAALDGNMPIDAAAVPYVVAQVEFYFSDDNLARDTYLRSLMDVEGHVPTAFIASFRRVAPLCPHPLPLALALQHSAALQVDVAHLTVRRKVGWEAWRLPQPDGSLGVPLYAAAVDAAAAAAAAGESSPSPRWAAPASPLYGAPEDGQASAEAAFFAGKDGRGEGGRGEGGDGSNAGASPRRLDRTSLRAAAAPWSPPK